MSRLSNKTALITGGASGIGLATAQRFIEEGARVLVTGSDPKKLGEAASSLGPQAIAYRSDAGDVASQARLAAEVAQVFGKLDVLFINAGVADFRPLAAWDEAAFDRSFAVNVKGPYFLVQALAPHFAETASVILNGSINAHLGKPTSSVYAASKAALISLARTLSGEMAAKGVRVNVISPGPVATPIYGKLGLSDDQLEAMQKAILAEIAAGRFGEPREIADAAVYLASDESRYTIGSEFIIDGGMSNL